MAARILFSATENLSRGPELWVTDGSPSGSTYALKDNGGNYVYAPLYLTSLGNGEMVFSAYDATNGQELWITDGTPAGTSLLKDINPTGSSSPGGDAHAIAYLGGGTHKAVFTAEDGSNYGNYDLWVTDGTPGGTTLLRDTTNSRVPYNIHEIEALGNGKAVFDADDTSGNYGDELWVTDGTSAGTYRIADIYSGFAGSAPQDITAIGNGRALFSAKTVPTPGYGDGYELWVTDGMPGAGHTYLVAEIYAGSQGSYSHGFAALGDGNVLFAADGNYTGTELSVTNATSTGTHTYLVKDINVGAGSSGPSEITPLGNGTNKAVFIADDGSGSELWVSDGTSGGTVRLTDGTGSYVTAPAHLTALGSGKAVFSAFLSGYGTELWVTDGTSGTGHTYEVKELAYSSNSSSPYNFVAIGGGEALFAASYSIDPTHKYGTELFVTNGTAAGTQLVKNIYPDTVAVTGSDPGGFGVLTPVCFCRGTLIRTDKGEVPVEALAVGDKVATLSGAPRPVRWIGFGRDLVTAKNPLARPIIVRRGALADNVPRRDLYLTHGHALYIDGVLIPVEHLVNHRSILWDDAARVVEYYHIELDGHDVVFAEGAAAETYHDAGNRAQFQNARPGSAPGGATPTYAPVLNGGDVVKKIWAALLARAGGPGGAAVTGDPDLHLVIDGVRHDAASNIDGLYVFALERSPAGGITLRSRCCVPSLIGVGRSDHRPLGVAIRQLVLHAPGVLTTIGHDALPALGRCHVPERDYCWTDGALDLPSRLFAHAAGALTLAVQTQRHLMRYPIDTAAAANAAA